jgi:hypothetical protein
MKITHPLRLCLVIATIGCAASSPALFGQVTASAPPQIITAEPPKTIPALKIRSCPMLAAVDELSRTIEAAHLPEMNVIYGPDARTIQVPDLVLRNVSGPDALRLITASAGCDMEPILGNDGTPIGFRVFTVAHDGPAAASPGDPGVQPAPVANSFPSALPAPAADPLPGANPFGSAGPGGTGTISVMGFGGMGSASASSVRVYSLGGITNTTKFNDVEATLRDVLKADGVAADAAKLAFHDRTNVLVVNADSRVQELVAQYLEALQKNVAAAMAEDKRSSSDRREAVEALIRLDAERDQRDRLVKQLAETEAMLRDSQRELDRIKAAVPKPQ